MGNQRIELAPTGDGGVVDPVVGTVMSGVTLAAEMGNNLLRTTDGFLPLARITMRTRHTPFL